MRLRIIILAIVGLLVASPSRAATIYMGSSETYKTLQSAFAAMFGGDTLIIRDGTYTGDANQIRYNNHPPTGSAGAYTVVKAENPGKVVFDGQDARSMFYGYGTFTMSYVQFDGMQFVNPYYYGHDLTGVAHNNRTAHHIKITRCGFENVFAVQYASYVLVEDCYVTGFGRYNFIPFTCDHVIFRRCIGRLDAAIGNSDSPTSVNYFPISHFVNYTSEYVEFQNCIAIDSDDQYYNNFEGVYGGFYVRHPNTISGTTYYSRYTAMRGNIILNVHHSVTGKSHQVSTSEIISVGQGATDLVLENNIYYDFKNGWVSDNNPPDTAWIARHNTFGNATAASSGWPMLDSQWSGYGNVENNLFWNLSNFIGIRYTATSVNNNFYGVATPTSNVTSVSGTLTLNPATCLKYLPRIETDDSCTLKTAASDGGPVGATVLYKIGVSGTLHGDTGYADTTTDSLWPWPYEGTIRDFFRTYGSASNPDPKRGFAADGQTLSKYVWEYLGNSCPPGMCDGSTVATTPTFRGSMNGGKF